jgi:membrane protein implicated in regulation of membrane protease activity
MMMLLAQEFHDIAPPVNYSLVPPWAIFVAGLIVLTIIVLAIWYGRKLFRKEQPTPSPRERALAALSRIESEVEKIAPYQFSIRVSDILRRYVMEQFDLPMTRQTSVEFLNAIAAAANFADEEKTLLADFLNRCDLIKFARYEATTADSRLLLDEAREFVKGEALVPA